MKLKLAGVAFGALMVGLVGAGEAKADAVAIATINVTSATLSATGVDGTALNINQVLTHLSTNGASLSATASVAPYGTVNEGPYTASNAGAVSITNVGTVTETATPASIGGSSSTSTSSITGSLLTGGVTNAIATTQLNLLNGTQGNANQAKTDTQTQFTF
ncbi:MAG TPA: hypothetical protein VGV37_17840, partial [Aliidongia sp.]|uniref:hypothetical protein n=1 Tax=Aliidongia sp. TaxID=1914230 RepID=UPI002DDD8F56